MAKAYKALQDSLVAHIDNTHPLSKNQIESILTLVRSTLDILEDQAYKAYDELPDMAKHILDEKDYRRTLASLQNKDWEYSNHKLLKTEADYADHLAWKAERVKYLQELFPQTNGAYPHTEEWFVRNNIMYNEEY